MSATDDYPRMVFHRTHAPVIVRNEAEEASLGHEWTRSFDPDQHRKPEPDMRMPIVLPGAAPAAEGTPAIPPPAPPPEPEPAEPDEQDDVKAKPKARKRA